jgi:hypothetical protein
VTGDTDWPDTYQGGGGAFNVFASVGARMAQAGQRNGAMDVGQRKMKLFDTLHQVPIGPIQVPITAGAGVYQMNDLLMPKAGYMWSVRAITASGYTAGSVIVYKGGAVVGGAYTGGGDPRCPFPQAQTNTFGRGEFVVDIGDPLIVVCTGITLDSAHAGVQINGSADCFEKWLLPDYLG